MIRDLSPAHPFSDSNSVKADAKPIGIAASSQTTESVYRETDAIVTSPPLIQYD